VRPVSTPGEATLCFLVRWAPQMEVLLALKKAGFGAGKLGGVGGKLEAAESAPVAAAREVEEEIGVRVALDDLRPAAHLTFLFPDRPAWDQVVHAYVVARWEGEPAESDEVAPAWFPAAGLPFGRMWHDCSFWLPRILAGEKVRGRFVFGADNETVRDALVESWSDAAGGVAEPSSR